MNLRKNAVVALTVASVTAIGLGTAVAKDNKNAVKLDTEKARLGYLLGNQIGANLKNGGMLQEVELGALIAAIKDSASGAELQMTPEQMTQTQQNYMAKMQKLEEEKQKEFNALAEKNKAASLAFLEKNKKEKGVKTTDSGLQYQVLRAGKGKMPALTDTVKIHYTGKLIDGTEFDSSYKFNKPAEFALQGVIPGFSEGLQLVKEGGKYRFFIPAEQAYGVQAPPSIGPNQALIFDIELLEIVTGKEPVKAK